MISRPPTLRTLIIEDEVPNRVELRAKLAAHPFITVVGESGTLRAARALLQQADYDLVFLDVQIIGGESFELIPDVRPGARIIFASAYDHYAFRAFEINALDYLLKPVDPARLALSLSKLAQPEPEDDDAPAAQATNSHRQRHALRLDDTVYLRSGQRARFAPVAHISVITAQDNYSEVLFADGTRIFLRKSLKAWEDSLPTSAFMRVHRTQIVNLTHVTNYQRDSDEHTSLFLAGVAQPVSASRLRWSELRERLAHLRPTP
ncbi:LytR/AlgR family response regulator transcription factor [Oleiharenicola lentus]|uniref:LytR/AlgR family response regulator transcription factor n=1 Tax=Oleiharenicola lentus TaxID=2508720 RepID=UPI003F68019F